MKGRRKGNQGRKQGEKNIWHPVVHTVPLKGTFNWCNHQAAWLSWSVREVECHSRDSLAWKILHSSPIRWIDSDVLRLSISPGTLLHGFEVSSETWNPPWKLSLGLQSLLFQWVPLLCHLSELLCHLVNLLCPFQWSLDIKLGGVGLFLICSFSSLKCFLHFNSSYIEPIPYYFSAWLLFTVFFFPAESTIQLLSFDWIWTTKDFSEGLKQSSRSLLTQ